MQLKSTLIYLYFGWALAPIVTWIEKYAFSDWEFLKFLFVIVCIDTFLGLFKAVRNKSISSKGFSMVLIKIIMYACALITTSALVKFTIEGAPQTAFGFVNKVIFSAIMLREAISIFENISEIQPNLLPGSILSYLKKFDSITGKKITNEN